MPCTTCAAPTGLQTCLFCGHTFCSSHRTERDGAIACTACNEQEHARRKAVSDRAKVAARTAPVGGPVEGGPSLPLPPPKPAPDAGWAPLLIAACVACLAGAYVWHFLGWALADQAGLPEWLRPAGTIAGGGLVLGGVWIIVKSRMS
jgi:hypothetical protein